MPADSGPEAKKQKRHRDDMEDDERKAFDAWLEEIRGKRQALLDKRSTRHHRKQQLAKRRTAASQERMRMISQLAKNSKKEDNFGMNDDDWEVYKKINKVHLQGFYGVTRSGISKQKVFLSNWRKTICHGTL